MRDVAIWRDELPGTELPWAVFGENLTTLGLSEADVRIELLRRAVQSSMLPESWRAYFRKRLLEADA
jgi:hypothetical protein